MIEIGLIIFAILIQFITIYLVSVVKTKGQNYATKKDIGEITKITETVRSEFNIKLENIKHESNLINQTYSQFVENIIEYYSIFYNHYIRCSRTANYDMYIPKGGEPQNTSNIFQDQLEEFSENWNKQLGKLMILLPDSLIKIHTEVEKLFNDFRNVVMNRGQYLMDQSVNNSYGPKYKIELMTIFKDIDLNKKMMEKEIRDILKVEKLKIN